MTHKEEKRLLETVEIMYDELHENNLMLKQIIKAINTYIARHNQENEDDFGRNVLANLVSSGFNLNDLMRRK
jgi:hypothetical protein